MEDFHCEQCGRSVPTCVEERRETFPVKGEPVEVRCHVRVCAECGNDIYDKDLDSASLEAAYRIYRERHNIISPAEIVSLRGRYGLSQRGLATLLGWGEITVHRYENGSLPDQAHNNMLKLLRDPKNMAEIFTENSHRLPERARNKAEEKLESLKDDEESSRHEPSRRAEGRSRPTVYTGFRVFSAEDLEEMILFFASKPGGVLKTKLNKLLWYTDFTHFRLHSVSISGTTYIHLPFGPVPDNYESHLSSLIDTAIVVAEEKKFTDEITGEILVSERDPDLENLPDTALPVLEAVWQQFKEMGSTRISELSHEEDGYRETKQGEPISYEYANRLKIDISIEWIE